MKKRYDFSEQLKIGKYAEQVAYNWLVNSTLPQPVEEAPMSLQRVGVDFIAGDTKIEVKLDNYCQKNGRYFLEIDLPNKRGWVHTCTADMLLLIVGGKWEMKVVKPDYLRYWIEIWQRRYGIRTCENKNNYYSHGVCVPMDDIKGDMVDLNSYLPENQEG